MKQLIDNNRKMIVNPYPFSLEFPDRVGNSHNSPMRQQNYAYCGLIENTNREVFITHIDYSDGAIIDNSHKILLFPTINTLEEKNKLYPHARKRGTIGVITNYNFLTGYRTQWKEKELGVYLTSTPQCFMKDLCNEKKEYLQNAYSDNFLPNPNQEFHLNNNLERKLISILKENNNTQWLSSYIENFSYDVPIEKIMEKLALFFFFNETVYHHINNRNINMSISDLFNINDDNVFSIIKDNYADYYSNLSKKYHSFNVSYHDYSEFIAQLIFDNNYAAMKKPYLPLLHVGFNAINSFTIFIKPSHIIEMYHMSLSDYIGSIAFNEYVTMIREKNDLVKSVQKVSDKIWNKKSHALSFIYKNNTPVLDDQALVLLSYFFYIEPYSIEKGIKICNDIVSAVESRRKIYEINDYQIVYKIFASLLVIERLTSISRDDRQILIKDIIHNKVFDDADYDKIVTISEYYFKYNAEVPLHMIKNIV